jgi:hypothetical protein
MSTGYSPQLNTGIVEQSQKAVVVAYNSAKVAGIAGGIFLSLYLIVKIRQGAIKSYRYTKEKMKQASKYRLRLVKE